MKANLLSFSLTLLVILSPAALAIAASPAASPAAASGGAQPSGEEFSSAKDAEKACSKEQLQKIVDPDVKDKVEDLVPNMDECNANNACKDAASKFIENYHEPAKECENEYTQCLSNNPNSLPFCKQRRKTCLSKVVQNANSKGKEAGAQTINDAKTNPSPIDKWGGQMTQPQGTDCLKAWAKTNKGKEAIKQMTPDQVSKLIPQELQELRSNNGDALDVQHKAVLKGDQIAGYLSGAPGISPNELSGFNEQELAQATQTLRKAGRYPPVSPPGRPGAAAGPGWDDLVKMSPEEQAAALQKMTPDQRAEYYQYKNVHNSDKGLELQKAGQEQAKEQAAAQMAMGLAEKLMGMAQQNSPSSQSGGEGVTESPQGIQAEDTKSLLNPYALPPESLVQSTPDCNKVQAGSALAETCKGLLAFTPNGAVKTSEQVKLLNGGKNNIATQVNNQDASLGPGSDILIAAAPLVAGALGLTSAAVAGSEMRTPLVRDLISEDVVIGDFNSITNTRYPIKSTADRPILYHAWTRVLLKGPPEWPKYQKRGLPKISLNYFKGGPPKGDASSINFGQLSRDFWKISSSVPDARVDLKAKSSFTTVLFKDGIPKGSSNMAHAWNTEAVTWNTYIVEGKGYDFVISSGAVRKSKGNRIIASMFGAPPSTLSRQQRVLVYSQ